MALQQEIIQALHVKPHIDAEQEVRVSVDFLKSYLRAHPFIKSLVLGISGGQDFILLPANFAKRQLTNCAKNRQKQVTSLSPYVYLMACRPMSRLS